LLQNPGQQFIHVLSRDEDSNIRGVLSNETSRVKITSKTPTNWNFHQKGKAQIKQEKTL